MVTPKKQTPAARQRSGAQESFLERQDSISLPRPGSHCGIIGFALLAGGVLNSTDWVRDGLESTKLTSRVSDLIGKFGWSFISKSPATRIRTNGRPQRVVFYRLSNDVIRSLRKQPKVKAWLAECRKTGGL